MYPMSRILEALAHYHWLRILSSETFNIEKKKIQVKKCLTKETGCLATSPLLKAGRDQTSRRNEFHFHPPTVTMGWVMKSNAGMQYKTVTLCSLQRYPGGMPPFHKSGRKVICHTEVSKYWNNFRKIIAI